MTTATTYSSEQLPRVLICDPIHADGITYLQKHAHVDLAEGSGYSQEELETQIASYHAVINRSRTSIPASVIEQGSHLRVIARAGVGLDNIDVDVAEAKGIQVINSPDAITTAVAEHTMALILGLARHVSSADQSMKEERWDKKKFMGTELAGKTLGIVGFGRIGRQVAQRARAFGMSVVVNQHRITPELAQEWRVERVDLLDLLRDSDFVTLHLPLNPSTRDIISTDELALMKPSAYLLNTSRGGIVDEDALLDALNRGEIAGAGLDVFLGEPKFNTALARHPRVLATPHIGASTEDSQRNAAMHVAEQVVEILKEQNTSEALSLRVVATEDIYPHEGFHRLRVERLAKRIAEDGLLANPPIVAEVNGSGKYVVLDGATRSTAFKHLGYPHMVVQSVDIERDNVQLSTWYHAVRGSDLEAFLQIFHNVSGLQMTEMTPSLLEKTLREEQALGYLVTADNRGYLLEMEASSAAVDQAGNETGNETEGDWLQVLFDLVSGYGAWGDVERTLFTDMDELKSIYDDIVGLVVFPAFAPDIVLQMAEQGRLLPAGITRFVIPGRILRLNAPLDQLASNEPISLKRDWLDRFVQEKLGGRQARYYEEPVVLLDE